MIERSGMAENSDEPANVFFLPFESGEIGRVTFSLYSAPKSQSRPVDAYVVTECEGNFTSAARRAAEAAYNHAASAALQPDRVVVGFDVHADSSRNAPMTGESGGLLFALSFAASLLKFDTGPVAATGVILSSSGHGPIGRVDGIAEKLSGAIEALPGNASILYPAANQPEISGHLRTAAGSKNISLHPVASVGEAVAYFQGIPKNQKKSGTTPFFNSKQRIGAALVGLLLVLSFGAFSVISYNTPPASEHSTSDPPAATGAESTLPAEPGLSEKGNTDASGQSSDDQSSDQPGRPDAGFD